MMLILFMSVLLSVLFIPVSNISLAQTTMEAPVPNSTESNFLTYEDTARGFRMQYPSEWNKTDYPSTIPVVFFMSPAQNATDKLFENLVVIAVEDVNTIFSRKDRFVNVVACD